MKNNNQTMPAHLGGEHNAQIPPLDENLLPTCTEPEKAEPDYSKPDTYSERVTSENMIDAIIKTQDLG